MSNKMKMKIKNTLHILGIKWTILLNMGANIINIKSV